MRDGGEARVPDPGTPSVTVVIPTHSRRPSLTRTLAGLSRQSGPAETLPDTFEVVVVADGCTDDTVPFLAESRWPFPLTVVEVDAGSAGVARNRGAEAARGEILLFLDDDVEPGPQVVEGHRALHRDREEPESRRGWVGLGPYLPVSRGKADFYRMLVRAWWIEQFHAMSREHHRFTYRDFLTGNVSLRRRDFLEAGGFDERFRDCGGEDWELGIRLLGSGLRFAYLPWALSWHHDHETTDLDRSIQRARREGIADGLIGETHRDLLPSLDLARLAHRGPALWKLVPFTALALPRLGDPASRLLRLLLPPLESLRWRRWWRFVYGGLRWYGYWRGVGAALGGWKDLRRHLQEPPTGRPPAEGLRTGEPRTGEGPAPGPPARDAVRVSLGGREVGLIPMGTGFEPLAGRHLPGILGEELRPGLLEALDTESFMAELREETL